MTVLPSKLYFTRDYVKGLANFLQSKGYSCTFQNLSQIKAKIELNNECVVAWSGCYRHEDDNYQPSPNVIYGEQGFLPHYQSLNIDIKGHGRHSSLINGNFPELNSKQEIELNDFLHRNYFTDKDIYVKLPKKFWLLTLQHPRDSTMIFDCPNYCRNYEKMVKDIMEVLPVDTELVVKPHPLYSVNTPGYIVNSLQGEANNVLNQVLLKKCEGVICVNSSYVFEALAYNKPVITMGTGVFSGNGVVKEVESIDNSLFLDLINNPKRNQEFLYELLFNRQICYSDFDNRDKLEHWWNIVEQEYIKQWK